MTGSALKYLTREPLAHFLLIGALLFSVHGWLNEDGGDDARVVRITSAEIDWLRETWTRQWQRAPDEGELRELATGYLKESLLAREAKALGLDDNDTIIRRRLAQKMGFLVEDTARLAEPGEEALRRFHAAGQARYLAPARVSFTQLFFQTEVAARKALLQLGHQAADKLGEPSLLPRQHVEAEAQALTSQFGAAFSRQVFELEAGSWRGPVASTYGHHLVRVEARRDAEPLPFEAVRARVLEDWQREQEDQASERFLAELLTRYTVVADEKVKPLLGALPGAAR